MYLLLHLLYKLRRNTLQLLATLHGFLVASDALQEIVCKWEVAIFQKLLHADSLSLPELHENVVAQLAIYRSCRAFGNVKVKLNVSNLLRVTLDFSCVLTGNVCMVISS